MEKIFPKRIAFHNAVAMEIPCLMSVLSLIVTKFRHTMSSCSVWTGLGKIRSLQIKHTV